MPGCAALGLRDLLGALSRSVREELDVRRKVNAQRRSTRRGAQIVVGISVGLALGLALFNHAYVQVYDSAPASSCCASWWRCTRPA